MGPWRHALEPIPGARERVFGHELAVGEDGWRSATVDSPVAAGRLPILERRAERVTRLEVRVEPLG